MVDLGKKHHGFGCENRLLQVFFDLIPVFCKFISKSRRFDDEHMA
jgi:hypothetical protein